MNIKEHPIHEKIYNLCREIEKLPASEQATKVVVMATELHQPVKELHNSLNRWQKVATDDLKSDVKTRQLGSKTGTTIPTPKVIDVCCGSRMFWFDKKDTRAVFSDRRRETHGLKDKNARGGIRTIEVNTDVVADFTNLPFNDNQFAMVVFDPPHLVRAGKSGWLAKKYGKLDGDWKGMLRHGFSECFRVLKPEGTLIFKWNERDVPVSEILELTPERPLVGQRCGKSANTHWMVFMKDSR